MTKDKNNQDPVSSGTLKQDLDQTATLTVEQEEEFSDAVDTTSNDLAKVLHALQDSGIIDKDLESSLIKQDITAASEPSSPRPTDLKIDVPAGQNTAEFITLPTPGIAPSSILAVDMEDQETNPTQEASDSAVVEKEANSESTAIGNDVETTAINETVQIDANNENATTTNTTNKNETANTNVNTETTTTTTTTTTTPAKKQEKPVDPNYIGPLNVDLSSVRANYLNPRAQEKYDTEMMKGVDFFFNNKFAEAKAVFEKKAKQDPLYSLGLSSMAFVKAITSYNAKDIDSALSRLTETYNFADAQVGVAFAKKPIADTVSHYFTNLMGTNTTRLPTKTRALDKYEMQKKTFNANGALRAHVVRAESALLMAILYLSLETNVGYLKAGLNLRRAYNSYSLVWQDYKLMGQHFMKYIDQDTVSGIQFGIGSVNLLLSSLPPKILKIVSAFGWTADKHLGLALLKLCLEGKRIRSPLSSLMLLSYYVTLTSYAPQVLSGELLQPALECLLDAQQRYPNSAFFLYFAGRVSRLARDLPISTQSFVYTSEVSQGTWAETTIGNLATFEIALNAAMALDWTTAAAKATALFPVYNTPALLKYFYGVCMEMVGNRTEAILAFAEAPRLIDTRRNSQPEQFVAHRVAFFEISGYQDLEFTLPALEILLLWNAFPCMTAEALDKCVELVDRTLGLIYEREKLEYDIRKVELAPTSAMPDYYDQRGTLLLIKASVLNALNRSSEGIVHLNWIIDNKDKFKHSNWIVPYAYWESGNVLWITEEFKRARALWEHALTLSGFDFEFRLATCLNLAVQHAVELGVPETIVLKDNKGKTTHGRKRLSVIPSKSTGNIPLP